MMKPFIIPLDLTAGTVSAGVHRAKCTEAKFEANKMRDGNNLVLEFEILTPGEEGRKLKMWQSMKPTVAWRYTKVFDAFGEYERDAKGNAVFASEGAFIKHFVNRSVKLQVSHSDYQGEARAQIDNVLPDGDGIVPPPIGLPGLPGLPSAKPAQLASLPKRTAPKAEEQVEETGVDDIAKELTDSGEETAPQPVKAASKAKAKPGLEQIDIKLEPEEPEEPSFEDEKDLPF